MRRILRGPSDGSDYAESLAIWGVEASAEEFADPPLALWPENEQAVLMFRAMNTQWNYGMGGATGLRYEAAPMIFRLYGITRDEWVHVFEGLQVMETEALTIWREESKHGR